MSKLNNFKALYDNFEYKLPFIDNLNSNYIPLYKLMIAYTYKNEALYNKIINRDISCVNLNNIDIPQQGYKMLIKNYSEISYSINLVDNIKNSYLKLFNNQLLYSRLLGNNFISCNSSIFYKINDNIIPLCIMVTKKEYTRYIRQCMLMKKNIHPKALKLLVNSEFDKPRSLLPRTRKYYNKYLKRKLITKKIEIIKVDNFDSIYSKIDIPKSNSIEEYELILANLSTEYLNACNLNNNDSHNIITEF